MLVPQNPGSKLALPSASCSNFARSVQVLEAQVHSQVERKSQIFGSTYNFPLSQLAIFLQKNQKCALPASAVHTKSSYIAKLVQIDVLVPKKGYETTDAELITARHPGPTDKIVRWIDRAKVRHQYLKFYVF